MAAGATRARWSGGRGSAAISLQVIIVVLAAVAQGLAPTAPTARGVVVTANKGTATTPGPPTVRHRMNLKADVDATPVSSLPGSPGTSTVVDVPVVAKTAASTTIRPPTVSSRTSFAESEGSSPKPEPDRAKPGAAGTAVELGAQPTAEPFGPGDKHRPSAVPAERPVRLRPETSLPSSTTRPRTTEPPASHQAGRARISSGDRPTPQPSPQPAKQPTRQLASQPASQTTTQPPSQPASQPTTQLASQPPSLPTTQLASQPPSQRASQPATQLASQPASQPAEWPQRRPTATAEAAAKIVGKPPARKPTAQPVTMASQGERPQAADATPATHPSPPAPPGPIRTPEDETTAAPHPSDEDQYPMYAEYPDSTANLTNNSGGEEGDVVPDPDAALRQDAEDEDERERASLAEDDAAASVPIDLGVSVGALSGQGGSSVGVVFDSVGDLRMSSGILDAGFEHEPVEESVAEILDIPVEPATDQDLRERDRLDGDVYHEHERAELQLHNQGAAGKQVVIVGAALALVAQFLCLASATRRLRPGHVDVSTAVLFNVELALVVENLVFMLGVQSVGEPLRCQWVALALHYLHLVAAGWFLANTAFLAYRLRFGQLPSHFRPVALTVWTFPAVLVSAMYAAQPRSYETHRYCWMAVQRGMLLTFVAPVTIMITINTALALRGLRARSKEDADTKEMSEASAEGGVLRRDAASPAEMRSSLRAAAAMLPLYSADWFLGVVAMDNSTFLTYPLLFLVSNGFLNWFMMVCAWLIVPRESNKDGNDWCGGGDGDDLDDEDELLMEDDDAGCWGKSSPSDSLLPPLGAALDQTALWGATLDEHAAILSPPRIRGQADQSRTRWGEDHEREDRGETSTYMRDVDLCPGGPAGPAGTGCPSRPGQELAEMRYDGGISTISS